jgi:hypothetical protein
MNKKDYEKPTMEVVQLKQRQQLLAGSLDTNRDDYGIANGDVDVLNETLIDGEWVWQ